MSLKMKTIYEYMQALISKIMLKCLLGYTIYSSKQYSSIRIMDALTVKVWLPVFIKTYE